MRTKTFQFNYEVSTFEELSKEDRSLMESAMGACEKSYSPYSHLCVGAAVRMSNMNIVIGANQENAAFPSGLCAERVALFSAGMRDGDVTDIAIAAMTKRGKRVTAFPCGACRQVMLQVEQYRNVNSKMRVLVLKDNDKVVIFNSAADLLPFAF